MQLAADTARWFLQECCVCKHGKPARGHGGDVQTKCLRGDALGQLTVAMARLSVAVQTQTGTVAGWQVEFSRL